MNKITAAVLALTLMGCTTQPKFRAEARGGYRESTADISVEGKAGVDYFARSQTTHNYEHHETDEFAYAGVGKEIIGGVGPVVEGHIDIPDVKKSEMERAVRAGVQVDQHIGDLGIFGTLTSRVDKHKKLDLEAVAHGHYDLGHISLNGEGGVHVLRDHATHMSSFGLFSVTYGNFGFAGPFYGIEQEGKQRVEHNAGLMFGIKIH